MPQVNMLILEKKGKHIWLNIKQIELHLEYIRRWGLHESYGLSRIYKY